MRLALMGLLLTFALPLVAADAPQDAMLEMAVGGTIDIGPDGTVVAHTLDRGLSPAIEKLVAASVTGWRFEPIVENGKPVIASTRMNLTLKAVPVDDDNMRLQVSSAWFGSPKIDQVQMTAPRYPSRAIKQGIGATVMLILRLDDQGQVIAAHPYQTSLSVRMPDLRAAKWRKVFEEASIKAAMRWKYPIGEWIGGVAVESTVLAPFTYTVSSGNTQASGWQAYVPGPISPAPWVDESALADVNTDTIKSGDAVALGSRFRLTNKLEGEFL